MAPAAHPDWYRELFTPSVTPGLIGAASLAGYRNTPVFLKGSRHVPPRADVVADGDVDILRIARRRKRAPGARRARTLAVRHYHPYPDGNGRIAHFLINVMLAAGGCPWTVIRVEDRAAYLKALETASIAGDVHPFAAFIA